jgi:hypothetical protein
MWSRDLVWSFGLYDLISEYRIALQYYAGVVGSQVVSGHWGFKSGIGEYQNWYMQWRGSRVGGAGFCTIHAHDAMERKVVEIHARDSKKALPSTIVPGSIQCQSERYCRYDYTEVQPPTSSFIGSDRFWVRSIANWTYTGVSLESDDHKKHQLVRTRVSLS